MTDAKSLEAFLRSMSDVNLSDIMAADALFSRKKKPNHPPSQTVFVGNLGNLSQSELREWCTQLLGADNGICHVIVHTEKGPNGQKRSKGFAFITFDSIAQAQKLVDNSTGALFKGSWLQFIRCTVCHR